MGYGFLDPQASAHVSAAEMERERAIRAVAEAGFKYRDDLSPRPPARPSTR